MNTPSPNAKAATLHYGDGEFAVIGAGSYVRCAVTQQAIPLPSLRYWSAERQEAYVGPLQFLEAATGRSVSPDKGRE